MTLWPRLNHLDEHLILLEAVRPFEERAFSDETNRVFNSAENLLPELFEPDRSGRSSTSLSR
jgi:hypothetical protein